MKEGNKRHEIKKFKQMITNANKNVFFFLFLVLWKYVLIIFIGKGSKRVESNKFSSI